ncbi:MAG: two-component sensor histidine kinase [Cyanobacteria bacterium Co-bin13]|nr:two-component sensor histidine kinase [Cyanobacteria bacterium Co-bin13]
MPRSRPPSFRRILVLRILLLSIPILLIGQYVTIRKARTSLLETARQNLASSAVQKGVNLSRDIRFLQTSLQSLSRVRLLQTAPQEEVTDFLTHQVKQVPYFIDCLQLTDGISGAIAFSTCNSSLFPTNINPAWIFQSTAPPQANEPDFRLLYAGLSSQEPSNSAAKSAAEQAVTGTALANSSARLDVVLAAPIYAPEGNLRYTLTLRARLSQTETTGPGFLAGDMVIIAPNGVIMSHPDQKQIGRSINDSKDADRLNSIVRNVQSGRSSTLHLFNLLPSGEEWLAGYTGVDVPISLQDTERWSVLAVTPLDYALHGLEDVRYSLIFLTLGLLAANAFLALILARSLSLPIEKLSSYAQQVQDLSHLKEAPRDFRVRELQNLANIFANMMKRLEERAQELRHAWQDAQMANQLKSEFLANTSHELRTPLNAIIGCVRLVKDNCCDSREEELEFLERADHAAMHLLRIINDILDIAKIESGTLALKPEVSDLRQILQEVVDLQSIHLQQKNLELKQSEVGSPVWILADRAKLKQVLINILYNAIKFTDKGQISVDIQVQSDIESASSSVVQGHAIDVEIPAPRALVTISDTGIGVDPQQQHRLFRPFVMVDGSTTRRFEGTGLGLAISKNFMDLMGGSIHLYSEGIGKGTTVVLALPLAPTPETVGARRPDEDTVFPRTAATPPKSLAVSTNAQVSDL